MMIRLWVKRISVVTAAVAPRLTAMFRAKVKRTIPIAFSVLRSTCVPKATIYLSTATWKLAITRNAISNISVMHVTMPDSPAHSAIPSFEAVVAER